MKECASCGENIPPKRLQVQPNTELCVDCQSAAEKSGLVKKYMMDVQPVMKAGEVDEINTQIVKV